MAGGELPASEGGSGVFKKTAKLYHKKMYNASRIWSHPRVYYNGEIRPRDNAKGSRDA